MSDIPEDLVSAMNWDFSKLRDKIIDLDLPKNETIDELVRYLAEKYQKETKTITIGTGEIAMPINKKMRYFAPDENHSYVRLRNSLRRGIDDGDRVPVFLNLLDEDVDKISFKIRSAKSKLSAIQSCSNHADKFRTKVGGIFITSENALNTYL